MKLKPLSETAKVKFLHTAAPFLLPRSSQGEQRHRSVPWQVTIIKRIPGEQPLARTDNAKWRLAILDMIHNLGSGGFSLGMAVEDQQSSGLKKSTKTASKRSHLQRILTSLRRSGYLRAAKGKCYTCTQKGRKFLEKRRHPGQQER